MDAAEPLFHRPRPLSSRSAFLSSNQHVHLLEPSTITTKTEQGSLHQHTTMTTHHPLRLGQRLRERLPPALRHAILAESSGNTPSATYGEPSNTYKYPPFLTADSDTSSSDATIIARPNPPHQETLQARRRSWEIQPGVSRREIEDLRRFHPGLVPEAVEILLNGPIVMQTCTYPVSFAIITEVNNS